MAWQELKAMAVAARSSRPITLLTDGERGMFMTMDGGCGSEVEQKRYPKPVGACLMPFLHSKMVVLILNTLNYFTGAAVPRHG